MMTATEQDVMKACGESGIRAMVAAFYRRVAIDDLIGPMYPGDDLEGSEERLAEFLLFRFGAETLTLNSGGIPACACATHRSESVSPSATAG